MEDQRYLDPAFDANSLTVPHLRSILLAHNVDYPSSAKKTDLVALFNSEIAPQARSIRSANARVRRTSRGIVDVASSNSTEDDDEEDEEEPPAPMTTRSSRRSTRARTEEAQETPVAPTPRARTRHSTAPPAGPTPTPRRTAKHARQVEEQSVEVERESKRPASHKSRASAATPAVKEEEGEEDASPFSANNVFQSGGSPPAPVDRRRTTFGGNKEVERRQSRDRRQSLERRRRTEAVRPARQQMDGAVVPTRKTFDPPAKKVVKEELEVSEEFTPDEQQDLVQAEQSGELVAAPRRRKAGQSTAPTAIMAMLGALLSGLALLWTQEKFNVGYCGVGRPSTEIAGVQVPDWADALRPPCDPCPPHAICDDRFGTECESGFVLTQHPLSLGGLIPIPPTCEPDSVRARKVDQVKQRAVEELREQNARHECGEASTAEVQETVLKQAIASKKRKGMSNDEFEDLWNQAVGEVMGADEVQTGTDGSGHFTLHSSSLARLPLACSLRLAARESLRQHLRALVSAFTLVLAVVYARHRFHSSRSTEKQAKHLATLALEKLSAQAALHAADPGAYPEGYVAVPQLRDDVLREEFSAKRRTQLWGVVSAKVEGNANVRPMVREGRSGDVGRVWEWVGAVGRIGSPNASLGEVGRRSLGGTEGDSGLSVGPSGQRDVGRVGKWEEGRSYY